MKIISTTLHGVLDYLVGILLIASPWLFGFYLGGAETWVPVALGSATIIYSLFTDYELGVFKSISMNGHLTLDMLSGIFLAASPWIFNFSDAVYTPHLWLGIGEIVVVLLTDQVPYRKSIKIDIHRPTVNQPNMNQPTTNKPDEEQRRTQR